MDVSPRDLWDRGVPWAGLAIGPTAWGINLQANYAAVPWICAHRINFVPALALLLAVAAGVGALLSWRHIRAAPAEAAETDGAPAPFLAGISVLLGILFALIILTQGAAALILNGCER